MVAKRISFTAPSSASYAFIPDLTLFTYCNFTGGTTFGTQNQSGGTDFVGGTKIFVTDQPSWAFELGTPLTDSAQNIKEML